MTLNPNRTQTRHIRSWMHFTPASQIIYPAATGWVRSGGHSSDFPPAQRSCSSVSCCLTSSTALSDILQSSTADSRVSSQPPGNLLEDLSRAELTSIIQENLTKNRVRDD